MKKILLDPVIENDVKQYLEAGGEGFPPTVVFGAGGMLGSYIVTFITSVNRAIRSPNGTTAIVRGENKYLQQLSDNKYLEISRSNKAREAILNHNQPLVIHAASPASVDSHLSDPRDIINSNIVLTLDICKAMSFSGGHLAFLSSGEVYGPSAILPTKESDYSAFDHLALRGSYPELKKAGEVIVKTWAQVEDFTAVSLRVYHTFGPGMRESDRRIFSALKSVIKEEDIILNSSGEATRSFLYVEDLVTAIRKTKTESKFEEYNVASGAELTILEFARKVASVSKNTKVVLPNTSQIGNSTRSPILRGLADTTKLQSTGWKQSVDLDQAIRRTIQSMKWRTENNFDNF